VQALCSLASDVNAERRSPPVQGGEAKACSRRKATKLLVVKARFGQRDGLRSDEIGGDW
jgi:hypothetical protein